MICPTPRRRGLITAYELAQLSMLVVTRKYVTAAINPLDFRQRSSSSRPPRSLPVHSRDASSPGAEADMNRMNGHLVWLAWQFYRHGMAMLACMMLHAKRTPLMALCFYLMKPHADNSVQCIVYLHAP